MTLLIHPVSQNELAEHFSPAEIVELGKMIGHYVTWGRMPVLAGGHKGACEIFVVDDAADV